MARLRPKVASRCGAVLLSLSLLLAPAASACAEEDSEWKAQADSREDFSRFAELIHSQSCALTDGFVADALLRAGDSKDSRRFRQLANRQMALLKPFSRAAKKDLSEKARKKHLPKTEKNGEALETPDPPLDLVGCAAACAKGMSGIASGDFAVADAQTAQALAKLPKFGDAQIRSVLPALATLDELLEARYFACDFPVQFVDKKKKEALLNYSMLALAPAPSAVRSFNWQSGANLPRLVNRQNGLSLSRLPENRGEQAKVASDGRQLAWLYKIAHQYEDAERWLRRVLPYYLQHLPDSPRAVRDLFYELGELRLFQNDKGDALQFYRQALAIDLMYPATASDSFWLLDRMAQTCLGLGRLEEAEEYARRSLASCSAEKADFQKTSISNLLSLPAVESALASKSSLQMRGGLQTLADQCWRTERYDQVRLILEFLLGKSVASANERFDLQQIQVSTESGDKKGAQEKNRMLLVQLGYLHLYDGNFRAGIDCFDRVLTAKQNSLRDKADYYAARGQLADDLGKGKQAHSDFHRAIHLYKNYCRNRHLDFEDLDWVRGYVDSLAWQNYIKNHFGKGDDYLAAIDTHQWRKPQVKVFVSQDAEKGFDAATAEKLYCGFETWTKSIAGQLKCIRVSDYEGADVTVERAEDNSVVANGSGGRTTYEYQFVTPVSASQVMAEPGYGDRLVGDRDRRGRKGKGLEAPTIIAQAHLHLLCRTPSASDLSPIGAERLFSLNLHEAGHALGLDGHSPTGTDIMYWKSAATSLTERDIASLSRLYAGRE